MKGDRIGEFEELTLLAVRALGDRAYGVVVQDTIEQTAGREVSLGAVYAALERMERKGFVRSAWSDVTPERGGKRKRLFSITRAGLDVLRDARRAREALWNAAARTARERP
jgi:PadR family transcriptional regulator, regulatory protein PadR